MEGTIRFDYDGRNQANSDFDNSLMQAVGGQSFKEDSLVLLYRPNGHSNWELHPDFTLNAQGSVTNKVGIITAHLIMEGQYAFGYRVHSISINEQNSPTYSIYPNPTVDTLNIDMTNMKKSPYTVEIYAINGQLMDTKVIIGAQQNQISMGLYNEGIYILLIKDISNSVIGTKRVIVTNQ